MSMAAMPDVAGSLWLRPGVPLPHNLRSTRRDWAAQLAPGRPAAAWPALLASLDTQCGHAHRLCSRLALAAATRSGPLPDSSAKRKPSKAKSVSMINRISPSTSSASRFGSSRAGRTTSRRQKA